MRNSSLSIRLIGSLMLIVATAFATAAQVMPYRVADRQVRDLIAQIESETNTFRADAQRSIDRSIWNNTRSEDSMDRLLNGFETATDNLRTNFTGRRSSSADVQTVLDRAVAVDRLMRANNFPTNVESEWTRIRSDLDTLAGYYSVRSDWRTTGTGYGNGTVTSTGWGSNRYTVTDRELRSTINRLRFRSSSFRTSYNRWSTRRGVWNNNQPNTTVTQAVNDLDTALNSYASGFSGTTGRDLDAILRAASTIDAFMRSTTTNTDLNSRWSLIRTDVNTLTGYYGMSTWDWQAPNWDNNNTGWNNGGNGRGWNGNGNGNRGGFDAMITGTYRLNASRSDNVSDVIGRSVTTTDATGADRQRRMLERRLQSPEMIVVQKSGAQVDIASSSARRIQLDTSGTRQTETMPNGRTMTTSVSVTGREMTINYEGDRMNDFFVSFTPAGRGLQVTRRVYIENTNQQVTVNSFYDKTDDVARWDSITYTNNNGSSGNSSGQYPGYYGNYPTDVWGVTNNSSLVARLDTPLSTRTLRDGDQFQMTVTSPGEYSGAIIRGTAYGNQSGSVSGRANMSFNFDSIQLRNGQTYRFAGIVDGVRTANGETVSVNNEGQVRDSSQTNKTVTRAGIGAALGALIGAIAGGGTGAAIGATVGAGAGAGSIVLQGRDNLDLAPGTEFRITATGPNRVNQ